VRSGDTLLGIARKYQMPLLALKRLNHLRTDRIRAGARLMINPVAAQSGKPAYLLAAGNAAPAPTKSRPAPEDAAPPARKTLQVAHHTVQKGDTLFSIAKRYRVNLEDLIRWNRLAGKVLKIGVTLLIRQQEG
jgi:membrane-bound lytic murein transglycosylase D